MPVNIVPARKAISYIVRDRAHAIEDNEDAKINGKYDVPSIVRLNNFSSSKAFAKIKVRFSKKTLMDRDKSQCQYCEEALIMASATIDHVIPKSKGGKTSWDNCVISCRSCNSNKGSYSLKEAGLSLLKQPKYPHYLSQLSRTLSRANTRESWKQYFIY
jgi:hypothetical protein